MSAIILPSPKQEQRNGTRASQTSTDYRIAADFEECGGDKDQPGEEIHSADKMSAFLCLAILLRKSYRFRA